MPGTEPFADDGVAGHSFHIGRRHVHAPDGTPAVIDWRAPVSRPFYRASAADPMNLELRRRFGFSGGELTAYEDEVFGTGADDHPRSARKSPGPPSRILIDEIERPRSGPMRDIVATIQPDQDDIVRAEAAQTVCVQGAPGTGKTAVGLHRVAYLLYAYREQVRRRGVVMVGPNQAFLSYIRNVLPALGEIDVTQTTVGELVGAETTARVRGGRRRGGRGRQGRRADGGGAAAGAVGVDQEAVGGGHAAARHAALAGGRLGDRGARARAQAPGHPVRRGPRDARAPDRARDPDPDGGRRGGLRRPHPRVRAAVPAGAGRGRRDLAQGGPGPAGVRAAVLGGGPGRGGRGRADRGGAGRDRVAGRAARAGLGPLVRRPTWCSSTRPAT